MAKSEDGRSDGKMVVKSFEGKSLLLHEYASLKEGRSVDVRTLDFLLHILNKVEFRLREKEMQREIDQHNSSAYTRYLGFKPRANHFFLSHFEVLDAGAHPFDRIKSETEGIDLEVVNLVFSIRSKR